MRCLTAFMGHQKQNGKGFTSEKNSSSIKFQLSLYIVLCGPFGFYVYTQCYSLPKYQTNFFYKTSFLPLCTTKVNFEPSLQIRSSAPR